jgi:hypothetical protein
MNRHERLEAIQRVARSLSTRSWVDIDLVLDLFDLPTADYGDWADEYGYVVEMLRRGKSSDAALAELDAYLRGRSPAPGAPDEDRIWRPGSFRLFVCHTSTHKGRAAKLATALERLSVHAFVAHDTIEPTRTWQDVIETALLTCDALCAFVTPDFIASRWCDQEVGFAVAQRKPWRGTPQRRRRPPRWWSIASRGAEALMPPVSPYAPAGGSAAGMDAQHDRRGRSSPH